uniref:nuclear pore complex protein Nup214-like n=1 Tax=Pristiophorus japonicus TaxID=55135 RepID=UPI00398EAC86
KKDEKRDEFLNFNDLCFGVSTERQHHYYMHYFENWDVLLAASAASIEVSIVARQPDKVNWELWVLEDAARAELPVTDNSDDTMPVGVGVDFTSQLTVRVGDEKIYAPSPVLMLLSTEGLLCPFHVLNSIPGVKTQLHAPKCPRLEGEREPKPAQPAIPANVLLPTTRALPLPAQGTSAVAHLPPSQRPALLPSVILPSLPSLQKAPVHTRAQPVSHQPELRVPVPASTVPGITVPASARHEARAPDAASDRQPFGVSFADVLDSSSSMDSQQSSPRLKTSPPSSTADSKFVRFWGMDSLPTSIGTDSSTQKSNTEEESAESSSHPTHAFHSSQSSSAT